MAKDLPMIAGVKVLPQMRGIPFCDLRRAIGAVEDDLLASAHRVFTSGVFLRGAETTAFEHEWAIYCGQRHCVCCASGTDALTLAAKALGLRSVSVQANSCWCTPEGLYRSGAHVRLVDIQADGSPSIASDSVLVPLFGRIPNSEESRAMLFDAAHVAGWRPPPHATVAWSFYPTKNLGAHGDAGAVTTNDDTIADRLRVLAGADTCFQNRHQITSRMDELQAALLRAKLRYLDGWNRQRRDIAEWYWHGLRSVSPVVRPDMGLHHLFVVRTPRRDRLHQLLSEAGIEFKIHYANPLSCHDAPWADGQQDCPNARAWCEEVTSLPCYPGLTAGDVEYICDVVNRL
jgi:dTDP-4-amino-4,6-dideoxygalactose transaminase